MPVERRLLGLATIHFVLGLVTRVLALTKISTRYGLELLPVVPLFTVVLCQASLIALWGVASTSSAWKRTVGLVAGAVYLEALLAPDLSREVRGIATVTITVTTACLLVLRGLGIRVARRGGTVLRPNAEPGGLRFSIRGLMIFTAAVAVLSAGARASMRATPAQFLLLTTIWAMCFVAVGLVALWAAPGEARLWLRGPIVVVISPVLGAFFAFAASAYRDGWVYILLDACCSTRRPCSGSLHGRCDRCGLPHCMRRANIPTPGIDARRAGRGTVHRRARRLGVAPSCWMRRPLRTTFHPVRGTPSRRGPVKPAVVTVRSSVVIRGAERAALVTAAPIVQHPVRTASSSGTSAVGRLKLRR